MRSHRDTSFFSSENYTYYEDVNQGILRNVGKNLKVIVAETKKMLIEQNLSSKIIVGSIRHLIDINRSVIAGADIITIPYKFFSQMANNPKTTETINEFNSIWREMRKSGLINL